MGLDFERNVINFKFTAIMFNTRVSMLFYRLVRLEDKKQEVRYRNLDMSTFHFRLWTWAVAALT